MLRVNQTGRKSFREGSAIVPYKGVVRVLKPTKERLKPQDFSSERLDMPSSAETCLVKPQSSRALRELSPLPLVQPWSYAIHPLEVGEETHHTCNAGGASSLAVAPQSSQQSDINAGPRLELRESDVEIKLEARSPTAIASFRCGHCDSTWETRAALNKHKKIHGPREHACEHCSRQFVFRKDLKRHVLSVHHIGGEPLVCDICERSFWRKDHLKTHQKGCAGIVLVRRRRNNVPQRVSPQMRPDIKIEVDTSNDEEPSIETTALPRDLAADSEMVDAFRAMSSTENIQKICGDNETAQPVVSIANEQDLARSSELMRSSQSTTADVSKRTMLDQLQQRLYELSLALRSYGVRDSSTEATGDEARGISSPSCDYVDSNSDCDWDEESDDAHLQLQSRSSQVSSYTIQQSKGDNDLQGSSQAQSTPPQRNDSNGFNGVSKPTNKRKYSPDEEGGGKVPDSSVDSPISPEGDVSKKFLPCFIDGCHGKDRFASGLVSDFPHLVVSNMLMLRQTQRSQAALVSLLSMLLPGHRRRAGIPTSPQHQRYLRKQLHYSELPEDWRRFLRHATLTMAT